MTYLEDAASQRPIGLDIDITEALASLWSAEVTYSTSAFNGLLTSLASGRCGMMISAFYINPKRVTYDMAPYLQTSAVIATAGVSVRTPDDLSGKAVVIEAGTVLYEDMIKALNEKFVAEGKPPAKLSAYPTQAAAAEQVLLGRADATVTDVVEASMRAQQTQGRLKIAYKYPPMYDYGIYINKDAANFAALKAGLRELKRRGILDKIAENYGLDKAGFDVVDRP